MPLEGKVLGVKPKAERGPLWAGPEAAGPNGGITFSMLSRWLSCRERFRVSYVEGWRASEGFSHRMEYGSMWHVCEEALAAGRDWYTDLCDYVKKLKLKYPTAREQIEHWGAVCSVQFPVYVEYWKEQADVTARTPIFQEQVFDVPLTLPSGRTVRLRGKFDAVDLIGTGKGAGVYLQENKTKGDIDEQAMRRQLTFDLQCMMYLTALTEMIDTEDRSVLRLERMMKLAGVRYNVVRRPLSGGKGTIKQREATAGAKCGPCKGAGQKNGARCDKCFGAGRVGGKRAETADEFYERLSQYIKDEPETYFMRWKVEVTRADVERFRERCLNPILEQLCDWYDWISLCRAKGWSPFDAPGPVDNGCNDPLPNRLHWQHPFGADNSIDEYGASDVDQYIESGSTAGLVRREKLFEELT